jgi:hypothetical protein
MNAQLRRPGTGRRLRLHAALDLDLRVQVLRCLDQRRRSTRGGSRQGGAAKTRGEKSSSLKSKISPSTSKDAGADADACGDEDVEGYKGA